MCKSCQNASGPAAAIYARVSTEEQTENSSLKTQVEACLKAATDKNFFMGDVRAALLESCDGRLSGSVLTKLREQQVFVDDGYSAGTLDRPALSALREGAGRDFCKVFVYDLDRLARDLADLLALDRELRSAGVEVLNVVFPSDPSAPGRLLFQMRGAFAEFERAQILERLTRGKKARAMSGQPLGGGGIPYGYRYEATGKGKGRYVVDEIEATWVRRMFEWLLEGRSVRAITKKLNIAGAPTKKGGKSWGKSSVHRVLTYSGYTGEAYWNKTQKIEPKSSSKYSLPRKNKAVLRPKEEWIPVQIPQIIDKSTFESAQTTLRRNAALASRNAKHFYSLRGRVKCGSCGHTMYGVPNRGNRYYRCGRRDSTLVTKCRGKSMKADLAEEAVWAEVDSILNDPSVITTELKRHHDNLGDDIDRVQSDIQLIKAALADCDRQQRRWLDAYRNDAITSDELRNELDAVRRTRAGLDERLRQLIERSRQVDVDGTSYQALESYVNAVRRRIAKFTDEEKLIAMEALGAEATWNGDSLYLNLSIPVPNRVEQLRPATF